MALQQAVLQMVVQREWERALQAEVCRIQGVVLLVREGMDAACVVVVHVDDVEVHYNTTKARVAGSRVRHCAGKGQEGRCCACKAVHCWADAWHREEAFVDLAVQLGVQLA